MAGSASGSTRARPRPRALPAAGRTRPATPLRLAVVGKGGAGKSVIAGTMARLLARRGHRVLALDSDLMPGLALSLGAEAPADPPLNEAAEKDDRGRWRFRPGIGPVRAAQRYATPAPDGVRLLQCGKVGPEGRAAIMPSLQAYYKVIHGLAGARAMRAWTFVGDLPAGPRQTAFDWAPFADTLVLVVEPTWQSGLTARRITRIALTRPGVTVLPVANKVADAADARRIQEILGRPAFAAVPADDSIVDADRRGASLLDHSPRAPAVVAIERLIDRLEAPTLRRVTAA